MNGYTQESTVDRIANPTGTQWGRGVLEKWSDPTHPDYPSLWSVYESLRPAGGYGEVLILNCLHNSEHDGAVTSALQAKALALVNEVWARDPGVPIWYGAKPIYPPGAVCNLTGPQGDVVANELADWVANLDPNDLIYRAPVLGPLTSNMTTDGCHLSAAGRAFTGQQLVAFFD